MRERDRYTVCIQYCAVLCCAVLYDDNTSHHISDRITTTHSTQYRPVQLSDTHTHHFVIDSFASLTLFFLDEDEDDDLVLIVNNAMLFHWNGYSTVQYSIIAVRDSYMVQSGSILTCPD